MLNTPPVANGVTVTSSAAEEPVDGLVKRHGAATYLFAAATRGAPTTATFALRGLGGARPVEVVGEGRARPPKACSPTSSPVSACTSIGSRTEAYGPRGDG